MEDPVEEARVDSLEGKNFPECLESPTNSVDDERLQHLEEQYELMNSSLIALTTHFAQVQFRLRQIVEAGPEEKEKLLKSLVEFAFRGIPDVENGLFDYRLTENDKEIEDALNAQRAKQAELIEQLKKQLADLEAYAYEAGEGGPPQSLVIEKQRVIIDQLKSQLNLNVDGFDKMSVEELRTYVDNAVDEVILPLKMKEQLVVQLKTQLADLERFIQYLQGDAPASNNKCDCRCSGCGGHSDHDREHVKGKLITTVKRITALLHLFASAHLHAPKKFRRNSPKRTMKTKHWGDLRAQLEMAIESVVESAREPETYADSDYVSDSEYPTQSTSRLATVVRKHLAVGIQNLMQHGLFNFNNNMSVVPFTMCFKVKTTSGSCDMHAWELVLKFYDMKNGEKFNSTPARKLSQSFNLDIVGGCAISAKQSLLGVIGNIIASHDPYKRSYDSQFKALVCAGLNSKMLVQWLRLILRCQPLLELYYADWSYTVKTGFEDAFASLEKLNQFQFHLPVDLAVRQLNDIKDAF
ncbi:RUN domain-containing protein 1 [Cimex lectularius]|uniref:RUN domain-containing protein n=1 Tax=Cimex lectularius TaxID=79782 RepID=A0A8I6RKW4_CIMLE|nr:RUN domain-containing protein 1 [Cimex lectularius]XP_014245246.1 RUN domain-containing protein 1 [Cimex lectularius]